MSSPIPGCRSVLVLTYRGDRSRDFARSILRGLDDEKAGRGSGPALLDCLLFAGHTGVSIDGGTTVRGFHPDNSGIPTWQLMDRLKNGNAFPGIVRDDTATFRAARSRGITVRSFEVILPEPRFLKFLAQLDDERRRSQYAYGFPNGDGDANCITWLERLGLPLLTGHGDEFTNLGRIGANPARRFGKCR